MGTKRTNPGRGDKRMQLAGYLFVLNEFRRVLCITQKEKVRIVYGLS